MAKNTIKLNGKVVKVDYYVAGGHVYEIPRGRGKPRAKACYAETVHGDGVLLWEEHGGHEAVRAMNERIILEWGG